MTKQRNFDRPFFAIFDKRASNLSKRELVSVVDAVSSLDWHTNDDIIHSGLF